MGHGTSCWPQTALGLSRQNLGSPSQKLGSQGFICVLVAVCDGGYGMDEGQAHPPTKQKSSSSGVVCCSNAEI